MSSREVRAKLSHPVIDSDAHWLDFGPMLQQRIEKIAGRQVAELFTGFDDLIGTPLRMTPEERRHKRKAHMGFWQVPMANTRDRATAMMPKLLYERLDEFGFDFSIMYPTSGMATAYVSDAESRQATCRAFNIVTAEHFADFADRLTPAAVIPMHTPEEAVAELHHCAELGLKVVFFPEGILRPLEEPAGSDCSPWLFPGQTHWFDFFGLDSIYDYDPVWSTCQELGFVAAFHGGLTVRPGLHWSITSYVANHVGQFAAEIRQVRSPEPYKGKGIRYAGEQVRRKVGKAAVGG